MKFLDFTFVDTFTYIDTSKMATHHGPIKSCGWSGLDRGHGHFVYSVTHPFTVLDNLVLDWNNYGPDGKPSMSEEDLKGFEEFYRAVVGSGV